MGYERHPIPSTITADTHVTAAREEIMTTMRVLFITSIIRGEAEVKVVVEVGGRRGERRAS